MPRPALTALAALLLALAAALPAAPQRRYAPDLAVGAKAGATLSRMSFSPKVSQGWLPGFTAGVAARYTEERLFGLVMELAVSQRGWREAYDDGAPYSYSRTLTYLRLPLLTHIRFGTPRAKAFVNLGPEAALLIADRRRANFDWQAPPAGYPAGYRTNRQLAMDTQNRFDYGITAGVGVELALGRQSLMLEGRYSYGLGNIFHASRRDYFSASRTMAVEITAAWLIRIL